MGGRTDGCVQNIRACMDGRTDGCAQNTRACMDRRTDGCAQNIRTAECYPWNLVWSLWVFIVQYSTTLNFIFENFCDKILRVE